MTRTDDVECHLALVNNDPKQKKKSGFLFYFLGPGLKQH